MPVTYSWQTTPLSHSQHTQLLLNPRLVKENKNATCYSQGGIYQNASYLRTLRGFLTYNIAVHYLVFRANGRYPYKVGSAGN
jgi:hypothetical protein